MGFDRQKFQAQADRNEGNLTAIQAIHPSDNTHEITIAIGVPMASATVPSANWPMGNMPQVNW